MAEAGEGMSIQSPKESVSGSRSANKNESRLTPRVMDPESGYDDEVEGLQAEETAMKHYNLGTNAFLQPTRDYFSPEFLQLILRALHDLDQIRPIDPIEFFSYYLLKHNPYYQNPEKKFDFEEQQPEQ